ncbi:TetR/AcrR family transcriptional regulator [Rhodococcus opacus]|nr:TetR/AcrR family transcriptional regulator [Rhodococcus opacus]
MSAGYLRRVDTITQMRARLTRNELLQRAAEEFDRHGYVHATVDAISGHSRTTKGCLYFHFTSKEALARGVIDEGFARFERACAQRLTMHTRAFEALIALSHVLADYGRDDPTLRAAFRLLFEIGDYRGGGEAPTVFEAWTLQCRNLVRRALEEGDLRAGTDPDALAEVLVEMAYGARVLAAATGALDDLPRRVTAAWRRLLPTLVNPDAETYFLQFAERRTPTDPRRGGQPTSS